MREVCSIEDKHTPRRARALATQSPLLRCWTGNANVLHGPGQFYIDLLLTAIDPGRRYSYLAFVFLLDDSYIETCHCNPSPHTFIVINSS
jgi:hypothetical protein